MNGAIAKFNQHLSFGWVPVAIPGRISGEPILYMAAFAPESYVKRYNEYRDHTKAVVALAIKAQTMARNAQVVSWSDERAA